LRPVKKLLNTLYVTTQGAYLAHEGEAVIIRVERETKMRIPILTLSGIVCFGQVSCSPSLLGLCGEKGVAVSFLSEHGKFLGRVEGPVRGNVLLRRQQYRLADQPFPTASIAQSFLVGKVANSRTVLQRGVRDHSEKDGMECIVPVIRRLGELLECLKEQDDIETIRGYEGITAREYFSVFDCLITSQKDCFFFRERSRRPPLDNMNALLSFLYTLLSHDTSSALESVGLDPQVGYLHAARPGRPGLALDLMEEFRAFLVDRLALSLVNLRQVNGTGFNITESGAVLMDDDTRKKVLVAYQTRKREEIRHPFLGETVEIGLLPYVQALLLARHIRGDLDAYPTFIWR